MFFSVAAKLKRPWWISHVARQSTALHFYQNKQLENYAGKQVKRLTLRQLVFFGRSMDEDRLIKSANYVRTELPIRIAHRIRDMHSLPYVVVTQEGVGKVYELYWTAFEKFKRYPPINNIDENEAFCHFLRELLQEHASVIPNLSLGLSLASPNLPADQLDSFMRRMLVSRISRRVLAEHHIALSELYMGGSGKEISEEKEPHVGVIFTGLNIRRSVDKCARLLQQRPYISGGQTNSDPTFQWPEVVIDGHTDAHFSYIREHLEYIVFELFKNAMHATVETHLHSASPLPPIRATIVVGDKDVGIRISDQGGGLLSPHNLISSPSDLFSFSHVRNSARMSQEVLGALRSVSCSEQGMQATVGEQVGWFNSPDNDPEKRAGVSHPRIGVGLPMSNIFARYFGGSLELVSLDGWGTDVYLRLPKLGTNLEGIEV